jgi:hypothetical protein
MFTNGSIDGLTTRPEYSEDGFPITVGLSIIDRLAQWFWGLMTAEPRCLRAIGMNFRES